MPRRYQYQPITGPVFRGAVAATLAWLPGGNPYPTKAPPPRAAYTVLEPILAPTVGYDPSGLQWQPRGAPAVRAPERRDAFTVMPPRQYDPSGLQWLPTGAPLPRQLDRRTAFTVLPPRIYDPAVMDWWRAPVALVQPAARGTSWTVLDPFPQAVVVYDPAGLQWQPRGAPLPRSLDRREAFTVLPPRQYDPAGMQWLLMGRPAVARRVVFRSFLLLDPLPAPPAFGMLDYAPTYVSVAPFLAVARLLRHHTSLVMTSFASASLLTHHRTRIVLAPSGEVILIRVANPQRPWTWDTGQLRFDGTRWTFDGSNNV